MLNTSNLLGFPLLTLTILLPTLGAMAVLTLPERSRSFAHALGVLTSGMTLALTAVLFWQFDSGIPGFQFVDAWNDGALPADWLPGGITYQVGLDGISLVLMLLTSLLTVVAMLFSWGSVRHRVREYVALMLVLSTGMLGVFAAMDLFLFYIFWELTLIPMMLLIALWGGKNRTYATLKFVLYTLAGSALMLVAIIALQQVLDSPTFRLVDLLSGSRPILTTDQQILFFLAFGLAFAVKVPLFPFHTWLPDAHVEAPTAGSVLLAGVLLKMGTYGFVRFAMPMFPVAANLAVPAVMTLAIIGIWYGAWVAYSQKDIKSLVAYSSVSHMGIVMVGIFAINSVGLGGGILQMVNHGLSTGALFLLVGMLYDRAHTRQIADFSGLWHTMPRFSAVFLLVLLSSIGLPGLNGFVGEWLSLAGAFRANPWYGGLAAFGVVLSAVYMLWLYQRVFFGRQVVPRSLDMTFRDGVALIPLVILIVLLGLAPGMFIRQIDNSSGDWIALVQRGALIRER